MCANPNMKARPSLLSKITDIGDEFPPFLVAPAAQKFILRIHRAALMQTTVLAATTAQVKGRSMLRLFLMLFSMTALAACDVPVWPLI